MLNFILEEALSAIAIIVSVVSLRLTWVQSKKINDQNLISNFYIEIYSTYLVSKIPEAREQLDFSDKKLIGFQDLVNSLDEMLRKSLYFKFTKKDFYNSLESQIRDVENIIADFANNQKNAEERSTALQTIGDKISSIYNEINKSYLK